MRYDPSVAPVPEVWLGLDEQERVTAVRQYHSSAHVRLPNPQGHAIVHTIVESQLAQGHSAASRALDRLVQGGLDRHEAVHAIGATLTQHMSQTMQGEQPFSTEAYDSDLDKLTAEGWRHGAV